MFMRKKTRQAVERYQDIIKLSQEVAEKVMRLSREDCLDAYEKLRQIYWPDVLGDKPALWRELSDDEKQFLLQDAIRYIENRIPMKERLRYLRWEMFGESDEQFNEWWESRLFELLEQIAARLN